MQQIHEGAQLQAGDVGPAAGLLHALQNTEKPVAIGRQAAAEGTILNRAMGLLQLAQQIQQGLGVVAQLCGHGFESSQLGAEVVLLLARETHAVTLLVKGDGSPHTGC